MALYKRLQADRLLVDDERARRVATLNHIEVVGSLGVLLLARERHLIQAVKPRLAEIQSAGIFLSERLVQKALRLAGED